MLAGALDKRAAVGTLLCHPHHPRAMEENTHDHHSAPPGACSHPWARFVCGGCTACNDGATRLPHGAWATTTRTAHRRAPPDARGAQQSPRPNAAWVGLQPPRGYVALKRGGQAAGGLAVERRTGSPILGALPPPSPSTVVSVGRNVRRGTGARWCAG